jgi:NADPH:quinone reductase
MRAVWWRESGPPSVLVPGTAPDPEPGSDQVLVRVEAAAISFVETQIRAGRAPRPFLTPPAILGNGVGGTVVAVGPGGDESRLGQRVVATLGGSGGYAELAVAALGELVPVPAELGLKEATALLAGGRTAVGLHRAAAPRAGETVLVEAAAGGVGSSLVQLAQRAGARVIGAAAGPTKTALVRSLGVDTVIDYAEPDWPDALKSAAPDGLDLAYDGVGGPIGATVLAAVRPGGRFVVHGAASGAMTDTSDAPGVAVAGAEQLRHLGAQTWELTAAALAEAVAGRLTAVLGPTFPLERAADAHAAIEARATVGRVLLLP